MFPPQKMSKMLKNGKDLNEKLSFFGIILRTSSSPGRWTVITVSRLSSAPVLTRLTALSRHMVVRILPLQQAHQFSQQRMVWLKWRDITPEGMDTMLSFLMETVMRPCMDTAPFCWFQLAKALSRDRSLLKSDQPGIRPARICILKCDIMGIRWTQCNSLRCEWIPWKTGL